MVLVDMPVEPRVTRPVDAIELVDSAVTNLEPLVNVMVTPLGIEPKENVETVSTPTAKLVVYDTAMSPAAKVGGVPLGKVRVPPEPWNVHPVTIGIVPKDNLVEVPFPVNVILETELYVKVVL